jgi:hypothetical protein
VVSACQPGECDGFRQVRGSMRETKIALIDCNSTVMSLENQESRILS